MKTLFKSCGFSSAPSRVGEGGSCGPRGGRPARTHAARFLRCVSGEPFFVPPGAAALPLLLSPTIPLTKNAFLDSHGVSRCALPPAASATTGAATPAKQAPSRYSWVGRPLRTRIKAAAAAIESLLPKGAATADDGKDDALASERASEAPWEE